MENKICKSRDAARIVCIISGATGADLTHPLGNTSHSIIQDLSPDAISLLWSTCELLTQVSLGDATHQIILPFAVCEEINCGISVPAHVYYIYMYVAVHFQAGLTIPLEQIEILKSL